ncbi:MAG: AAA family ATPase [Deltaproteobacteria bacterium]|nr:AAA family ATPase [Deltaproteobacteria bacterium]
MRGKGFQPAAADFGLPAPKGVLLLGVPGCGKSLTAKAVAHAWQMPLLRLDLGRIFSGLLGSSEENMRKAIKVAEGVAPAVLWVDEIEKGLGGSLGGTSDGGTGSRVFGTLLTWMQEKAARVFVVATANRIEILPPELLRRGRFDEIFFVDLPGAAAREEIARIHLSRRGRNAATFDLARLAETTDGFSGAELEHCVVEGLFHAFDNDRDLTTEDLLSVARDTIPLSITSSEELQRSRAWASTRARNAEQGAQPRGPATRTERIEIDHG